MDETKSETREAYRALIGLLEEIDNRFLGPEWGLNDAHDVAGGTRAVMHLLQGGLFTHFEDDPAHPRFLQIVSPTRKFTGDNADAIYYDSPIDPKGELPHSRQHRGRGLHVPHHRSRNRPGQFRNPYGGRAER